MDIAGLVIALAISWAAGIGVVLALPRRTSLLHSPGGGAWTIGAGGFAGALLATLWLRTLSLVEIRFGFSVVVLPLAGFAAVCLWLAARRERAHVGSAWRNAFRSLLGRDLVGIARWLWSLLLVWLVLRFALLLIDVILVPVYPWDAWTQWSTKARVWYELGYIARFVPAAEWLTSDALVYLDAAPHYPGTSPLLQVFACIGLGRWDDALMNVPFWTLAVALACAIYGALRALAYGPLGALIGAWLAASLPLANMHVALSGYADLPLAGFMTLAVLSGFAWWRSRELGDGLLAVLFVAALPFIKVPGRIWVAILASGLIVAFLPKQGSKVVGIGLAFLGFTLLVLAQTHPVILNYTMHLDFAPEWNALADSFFLLGNWNLLWYGALAAALLGWRQMLSPRLAPLTAIVATSAFFLFVVFNFTNAREWVADQTTVNRATLHIAPVILFWMLAIFREWYANLTARENAAAETVTVEPAAS